MGLVPSVAHLVRIVYTKCRVQNTIRMLPMSGPLSKALPVKDMASLPFKIINVHGYGQFFGAVLQNTALHCNGLGVASEASNEYGYVQKPPSLFLKDFHNPYKTLSAPRSTQPAYLCPVQTSSVPISKAPNTMPIDLDWLLKRSTTISVSGRLLRRFPKIFTIPTGLCLPSKSINVLGNVQWFGAVPKESHAMLMVVFWSGHKYHKHLGLICFPTLSFSALLWKIPRTVKMSCASLRVEELAVNSAMIRFLSPKKSTNGRTMCVAALCFCGIRDGMGLNIHRHSLLSYLHQLSSQIAEKYRAVRANVA
ncbi:hypothetical protein CC86DRAFT_76343 [Ophiobolus disseminans]|uniref:Uncharacterized protein n=1 Tax=Ophiobolus disseminans TaxID=1469910 RepID=A0A6A6ZQP1_9PLEO|nr:hypothetical protein CC86DRAFT_76343 [Ophiobolus disseminans]